MGGREGPCDEVGVYEPLPSSADSGHDLNFFPYCTEILLFRLFLQLRLVIVTVLVNSTVIHIRQDIPL